MKCLSVRQPWAWAIIYAGKNIENRSWTTSYRGRLLIHAGSKVDAGASADFDLLATHLDIPLPNPRSDLKRGGIIGVVDLVDVVTETASPWFEGRGFGWVLRNPEPIDFKRVKGQLGLFDVDWKWDGK